jgi:glutathionyl-hydroquinone reductase
MSAPTQIKYRGQIYKRAVERKPIYVTIKYPETRKLVDAELKRMQQLLNQHATKQAQQPQRWDFQNDLDKVVSGLKLLNAILGQKE